MTFALGFAFGCVFMLGVFVGAIKVGMYFIRIIAG